MKNKFIKSTIILLFGGLVTKVLGMIIKIVSTRLLGSEGIGTYMLIMPSFSLLLSISQFSFPTTISKLVSENKRNNKNLLISIIPISLLINFILMFIIFFASDYISINLLHNENTRLGLKYLGFALPFISISSIIRGYFFGKERVFVHVFANIFEDIVRLISIIIGIPITIKYGIQYAILYMILSNIISELSSIFIFSIFLPKKIEIKDLSINKTYVKDIFSLSFPTTLGRLIGNIGYFFEPIIITNILGNITNEYGILNGYVIPILFLPSFFTTAISQALIPVVSNSYVNKKYKYMISKLNLAIFLSLSIGIFCSLLFFFFPDVLLNLLYKNTLGTNYLKFMSIFFVLYYIEMPVNSALHAMGFVRETLKCTIYSIILKTLCLIVFCNLYGFIGIIYSIIINIVFQTFYNIKVLKTKVIHLRAFLHLT